MKTELVNNGPYYFLIALCLGLIYIIVLAYIKPLFKKSDKPKPGKVTKMKLDELLDFDEKDIYR